MKKIIVLTTLLILACSGSVFAATLASGNVSSAAQVIRGGAAGQAATATNPLGRLSTGVRIGVNYATTCYALITKHDKGSKKIGTAHDSTAIYFVQEPAGALAAAPTACGKSDRSHVVL